MLRRKHEGQASSSSHLGGHPSTSYSAQHKKDGEDKTHPHRSRGRAVAPGGGGNIYRSSSGTSSGWFCYLLLGLAVLLFVVGSMRDKKGHLRRPVTTVPPDIASNSAGATHTNQKPIGQLGPSVVGETKNKDAGGAARTFHEHDDGEPPEQQRLPPEPHKDAEDTHPDDSGAIVADTDTDADADANALDDAHDDNNDGGGDDTQTTAGEATAAMLAQPSSFVDGEKKLKAELRKLKERQAKGMDRGVKTLTQWLGDDIPAWTAKENEAEWTKKVEQRKAELKAEDDKFWAKVRDHVVEENGRVQKATGEKMVAMKTVVVQDDEADNTAKEDEVVKEAGAAAATKKDGAEPIKEYPSPAAMVGNDAVVILEPTFGKHRPDEDAIFAFAEGYDIKIYLAFIESLKATGFTGDVVLSVSSLDKLKPGVEKYLRAQPNLVVYTVDWKCYTGSGKLASGPKEGMRMCQFSGMYGTSDADSPDAKPQPADDPREARPVATARYELYWAWSLAYHANSWLMLIDSRDAVFQTDPFKGLPREDDEQAESGQLYFFEENAEATTIGQSQFNSRWLKTAYGVDNVSPFFDKPVVCSGSTMGEQVAIEAYLRAMVVQFDETHCKVKGCDQGFHNYLHYSHGLEGVKGIESVKLWEQGKGIINNLGLLRDKPLRERGLLKEGTNEVLNWDGSISPVAHQFDRDDELKGIVNGYKVDWLDKWNSEGTGR